MVESQLPRSPQSNQQTSAPPDQDSDQGVVQGHVHEHVELIARHEQEFLAQRTHSERLGDRIAVYIGSLTYVAAHITIFGLWVLWNTLPSLQSVRFDPFPFPFLDTIFALEAILVASFILMRQTRMSRRADERDQLMLQVLLLTEREITAVVGIERQIASRMGLHKIAQDEEITELSEQTSFEQVAQAIKESLPSE